MVYSLKLYIGITTSRSLALSIQSGNREQFLNATYLLFLSAAIIAVSAPCQTTVSALSQVCFDHCNHMNLTLSL